LLYPSTISARFDDDRATSLIGHPSGFSPEIIACVAIEADVVELSRFVFVDVLPSPTGDTRLNHVVSKIAYVAVEVLISAMRVARHVGKLLAFWARVEVGLHMEHMCVVMIKLSVHAAGTFDRSAAHSEFSQVLTIGRSNPGLVVDVLAGLSTPTTESGDNALVFIELYSVIVPRD
jgi:hypothetical protein